MGDVLVTSGLGGRFPEGYPVALPFREVVLTQRAYTVIQGASNGLLQRLALNLLLLRGRRSTALT